MRACVRVCLRARIILFLCMRSILVSLSFLRDSASFLPRLVPSFSLSPIRLSRNVSAPPARLEPFTPCWVSHRNLLKARFHPRGSNHRRENPMDPGPAGTVLTRSSVLSSTVLLPSTTFLFCSSDKPTTGLFYSSTIRWQLRSQINPSPRVKRTLWRVLYARGFVRASLYSCATGRKRNASDWEIKFKSSHEKRSIMIAG